MYRVAVLFFLFALSAYVAAQSCTGNLIQNNANFDSTTSSNCPDGNGFCCVGTCSAGSSINGFTITGNIGLLQNTSSTVTQSGKYAISSVGQAATAGSISQVITASSATTVSSCTISGYGSLPNGGSNSVVYFTLTSGANVAFNRSLNASGTGSALPQNNPANAMASYAFFSFQNIFLNDGSYTLKIAESTRINNGIYIDSLCMQCTSAVASGTPSTSISPSRTSTVSQTISKTSSVSLTISITPSSTATISVTRSPSATISVTKSSTATISVTRSPSATISVTRSPSATISVTKSPTKTISMTATTSRSRSASSSETSSRSATRSITASVTPTRSVTSSTSPTRSFTRSVTPSSSVSVTTSVTSSATVSRSITKTPSSSISVTKSVSTTPSVTQSPSITSSVTKSQSITPSNTATRSLSRTSSISNSVSITPSITSSRSITPSITPSVSESSSNSRTSSRSFSASRTSGQSATQSRVPSATRSTGPSRCPVAGSLRTDADERLDQAQCDRTFSDYQEVVTSSSLVACPDGSANRCSGRVDFIQSGPSNNFISASVAYACNTVPQLCCASQQGGTECT